MNNNGLWVAENKLSDVFQQIELKPYWSRGYVMVSPIDILVGNTHLNWTRMDLKPVAILFSQM